MDCRKFLIFAVLVAVIAQAAAQYYSPPAGTGYPSYGPSPPGIYTAPPTYGASSPPPSSTTPPSPGSPANSSSNTTGSAGGAAYSSAGASVLALAGGLAVLLQLVL